MIGRCRTRSDFAALARGRRLRGRSLWLRVAVDGDDVSEARVAFAIGRSQGTAVERNRLRRRIREVLRTRPDPVPAGRYLFGARRRARDVSFSEVERDVETMLDQLADRGSAS